MAIENKILTFGGNKIGTVGGNKLMGFIKPDAPLLIPNLALWLNNDVNTMTVSGANKVSLWADSSPNSRNFIQSTGANQPLYVANVVNGQGGVFFADNTAQRLASTFASTINAHLTMTVVWSQQAPRTRDFYVFDGSISTGRNAMQWDSNNIYPLGLVVGKSANPIPTLISTIDVPTTASNTKYYENGILKATGTRITSGNINGLTLGNRFEAQFGLERTLNGYIHEVIIHAKEYTVDERTLLIDYLKLKYAIL